MSGKSSLEIFGLIPSHTDISRIPRINELFIVNYEIFTVALC